MTAELVAFDHLIVGVPDLIDGCATITRYLGVEPAIGGEHPHLGTANALLSLGGARYLEILGPRPGHQAVLPVAAAVAGQTAPDILTFAMSSQSLVAVAAVAGALGLVAGAPSPGSRVTPEGDVLQWSSLDLESAIYRGLVPFFIDWQDSAHPGLTSPPGAGLESLVVAHPEPAGLQAIYDGLGIEIPVRYGNRSAILARIRAGEKVIELVGSGRGLGMLSV